MDFDRLQQPFAHPADWSLKARSLVGAIELEVAGYAVAIEITGEQLEGVYLPLLAVLTDYAVSGRRLVAGLGGIPGSGKSTFAAALACVADRIWAPGQLVVVGMDGWHYPNSVLDERTILDEEGRSIPLRRRKGGPQSFDVAALAASLESLQTMHRFIHLPAYDRRLHDPVARAILISPQTHIVLVEGNFLLSTDSPWDRVSRLLKPKLFLEESFEVARERIVQRHIRGGAAAAQAEEKYRTNDLLNIDTARETAANADFVIRLDPRPHIRARCSPSDAGL